ncbi:hypothetical protein V1318_09855 [Lysobacter sp. CCNWLW3]|uniref:hypothetical protein n=1 Tax=unclassified Lysobacter TaxID=2635362 RepID=UPI002FD43B63
MRGQGSVAAALTLGLSAALCASALFAADPVPASAEGPAGRIRLPAGIEAAPAATETTAQGQRIEQTLTYARNGKSVQGVLLQSCVTAPPDLRMEENLQVLMQGLAAMQRQAVGKVNGWVTVGERRGYRLDSERDGAVATTMWMVPVGEKMAMLRFERPLGFALDEDMIVAIERMELRCGTTP